jgi:hypothetical protein
MVFSRYDGGSGLFMMTLEGVQCAASFIFGGDCCCFHLIFFSLSAWGLVILVFMSLVNKNCDYIRLN